MYQSGRAGDEAKKRKSPAKSGRVGITEVCTLLAELSFWYAFYLERDIHALTITSLSHSIFYICLRNCFPPS